MGNKDNVKPEIRQIRSALDKMNHNDEFMITIPIQSDYGDDARTEEKEKTDRLIKAYRKERQHGREEI